MAYTIDIPLNENERVGLNCGDDSDPNDFFNQIYTENDIYIL